MVFVKVRETYDLKTVQNKMTVIGIHTPKPDIIKNNYPGLLMQCRAYRPYSCNVRISCASMMPLDPLGVGTGAGDVAPEDIFNPILYKAMSNKGMSQLEARINLMAQASYGTDINGSSAAVDVDSNTTSADEFPIYYGLLANTHDWKHANPQMGLEMTDLKPLVYEMVYNVGDMISGVPELADAAFSAPDDDSGKLTVPLQRIIGKAKEFPFLNCTSYSYQDAKVASGYAAAGFNGALPNCEQDVPYLCTYVGAIIIPPSRLHSLYFRMVCEWVIEFTALRPISEICNFENLGDFGSFTHYQNYSYESTKQAVTGSSETILRSDAAMVSSNVNVDKVM